ncbi:MAG: cytochrome b N-terminal domain-containing protein [Gemmatimonadetes bacterium]|nr:cytochrome b N-terminal domain-containing protein [Gemmatimonadota bacterium]
MRDLHVWSASLIVVAALAHMGRVFFDAAYKPPRETNWLVGLLLLFLVLAFGSTGYLLPWDQWAYWTVTEVLDALARLPLIGGPLVALLRGDAIVSGATLSRFFALHVIVLPWVALVLLGYHFTLVRKHGIAPPKDPDDAARPAVPFFPHHLLRSFSDPWGMPPTRTSPPASWSRPGRRWTCHSASSDIWARGASPCSRSWG